MSNSFKIVMGLVLTSFIAACGGQQEEVVYTEPAPMMMEEPTYSKY